MLVDKLRAAGAAAVTLFNRSYQIDIDLNREQLIGGEVFSHEVTSPRRSASRG